MTHSLLCLWVALLQWTRTPPPHPSTPSLHAKRKNRLDQPRPLTQSFILTMNIIIFISSTLSLCLPLKFYVFTHCYCIVLWFWIRSRCIVTLPEVYHYSSSVSVGKWTCCSMAEFNFPCLRLSLSNLQPASIVLLPPCGSLWQTENTISLIIGIIWSSFAFDCKNH